MGVSLEALQDWMVANPSWTGFVIFLISFAESMAIIGVFIPGASFLIAAGAMVGAGFLGLWSSILWAAFGAILGDNLSYWIGYRFRDRLHNWWPFTRYPNMLERGKQFFQKHGGKSVALGRFIGPIRAVIPAIAGLMHMRPGPFFLINVASAFVWAPTYLFPGIILGAFLKLASEIAGRLTLFMLLVILLLWISFWVVKKIYLFLEPRIESQLSLAIKWSGRNRILRLLTATIVDPDQPETKGLFSWALILLTATWLFAYYLTQGRGGELSVWDFNIYQWLQNMRTPLGDTIIIWINSLGEKTTLLPAGSIIAAYLLVQKQWVTAIHWISAITFTSFAAWALGYFTPSMAGLSEDIPKNWHESFPQFDTSLSITFFGFLAVIIAQHFNPHKRSIIYSAAVGLCIMIVCAKLYLGLSNASFSLGSVTFAFAWTSLLGIAYRRHHSSSLSVKLLGTVAMSSVLLFSIISTAPDLNEKILASKPIVKTRNVAAQSWWNQLWKELPGLRKDIFGRHHPLNLQWMGKVEKIKQQLELNGWSMPNKANFRNTLLFMNPNLDFKRLPVLPHVYNGKHENLVMVLSGENNQYLWVLRLWQTSIILTDGQYSDPLYVGNVTKLELQHPFGMWASPKTSEKFNIALNYLKPSLSKFEFELKRHPVAHNIDWNNNLFIIRDEILKGTAALK